VHAATRRRIAVPVAITSGLFCSGLVVWHSSYAAFTAETRSTPNTLSSGNVALTNDHQGTARFTATNLVPGSTDTQCVVVTYSGTTAATVGFYATPTSAVTPGTDLSPYLDFKVEELDAGQACVGGTGTTLYTAGTPSGATGTLGDLVSTHGTPATRLGSWAVSSATPAPTRTYRFKYTLKDDTAAQNRTATVDLVWQAKSTAGA
jgi:hypothetical protein